MRLSMILACLLLAGCASLPDTPLQVQPLAAHASGARLRGLSAVDARVAWASGQNGLVLRTLDGGAHWQAVPIAEAASLDLRDIEAFDADHAVALSIGPGEASRLYRTDDGGRSWREVARNRDPQGFWDCMAFDRDRGLLLGDPVDGRYQVLQTLDAGRSWRRLAEGPRALEGEAAFAASGSCIARMAGGWVVSTGGAAARLHLQRDGQRGWRAVDAGMARGIASAGVFSATAQGSGVFAVGGDYRAEQAPGNAAALVSSDADGVRVLSQPRGYRSGVACAASGLPCIAVGPGGVDAFDGEQWTPLGDTGFDAVDIANSVAWLSGADGRLARIVLPRR